MRGKGDGTFEAPINLEGSASSLAIGDVTGDGNLDILTLSTTSSTLLVGDGKGKFSAQPGPATGFAPEDVRLADLNGDNRADVIVLGDNVEVFLSGEGATFSAPVTLSASSLTKELAVGDLDGDSKPDIVVPKKSGAVTVNLQTSCPPG